MIVTVCNIFAQKAYRPLFPGVLGTSDSRPCCFYCGKGLASTGTLNSKKLGKNRTPKPFAADVLVNPQTEQCQ